MFDLPDKFNTYLRSLSKQTRSNYRRDLRRIAERDELIHRIVSGENVVAGCDAFCSLHQERWNAAGQLGHFIDWPESLEFNKALIECFASKGMVRIFELWSGEQLLASQYCFVFVDRCYWRPPARRVDSEFEKLGPGRISLIRMLEELIGEGVRHVEAGPGHYAYKIRHGGNELRLRPLWKSWIRTRL